ncbi:hypothetical protein K7X08_028897 [Anisodus acutangulus]|uniref:RRM domain-containing protein n=1 Tax=Anisodus acutangulus TaxID=402998 RepID=A0A9Q1L125_9SOLA|nr:hypothetical protein K7X08_028897 [Anisodus acutangulus]
MAENPNCTVYVGNLDERVSDRVLYDILIQAGRVVDLYIPRDKETDKPKGFAFAKYESEEVADYAVKLFCGLVTLYNRTLKFAVLILPFDAEFKVDVDEIRCETGQCFSFCQPSDCD